MRFSGLEGHLALATLTPQPRLHPGPTYALAPLTPRPGLRNGVDPVSWTRDPLGERSPRWASPAGRIRWSSGNR